MRKFKEFEIVEKHFLHESTILIKVFAPLIAKNSKAGQFVILRAVENGERIPLTIFDSDEKLGLISLIFKVVGATTQILKTLKVNDILPDLLGPLGKPTTLNYYKKVCVVCGGVGCVNGFPVAKSFKNLGTEVYVIVGFKNKSLIILKNEFENLFKNVTIVSDDGSSGVKGLVTDVLENFLNDKIKFDLVFAAGPLKMMKSVSELTKKFKVKTIVSMNPIMIDGTGMCGSCRVTVDGCLKFACVDGPDFDGHLIDFDETITRAEFYKNFEKAAYKKVCCLLKEPD